MEDVFGRGLDLLFASCQVALIERRVFWDRVRGQRLKTRTTISIH